MFTFTVQGTPPVTYTHPGSDLRGAKLRGACLRAADLRDADFTAADLREADLRNAILTRADLRDVRINWGSHDLVAEILRRHAGEDMDKRMLAGLILISRDWCWSEFAQILHPRRQWAIDALASHLREDDDGMGPDFLRQYRTH